MPQNIPNDFHNADKGYIISPAGFGKTETIVDSVALAAKRQLVLTHTHAGVYSLRSRFKKKGISLSLYHIDTIDSFTYSYLLHYPCAPFTHGADVEALGSDVYWSNIREGFLNLLDYPFFVNLLQVLYGGVYVDEYQDTSPKQHDIVLKLSTVLPCKIVGDPYQAVFGFHPGEVVSWSTDVEANFPKIGELTIPYRWQGSNPGFGRWLIDARRQIFEGGKLDLRTAPKDAVRYYNEPPYQYLVPTISKCIRQLDTSIVITSWQAAQCHKIARSSKGLISSMEEMECKDLRKYAVEIDRGTGEDKALLTASFLADVMTEAGKPVRDNLQQLLKGKTLRNAFYLKNKSLFDALLAIVSTNDYQSIHNVFSQAPEILRGHIFRRELYYETLRSLSYSIANLCNLVAAVEVVRYRTRVVGRVPNLHSISRVLLIKGLEYKNAVVLNPEGMNAKELYVAITRPTHTLTIYCKSPVITPKR